MLRRMGLVLVVATVSPRAQAAADLSGAWEVQTMGADREIKIEQRDTKIIAHRILWPEFEGKKYKLEHLYRGTLKGSAIAGQLLVKEEDAKEFEVLRDFAASITDDSTLAFDAMPVKRAGHAAPTAEPGPDASAKPPPSLKQPSAPPPASATAPPSPPPAPAPAPAPSGTVPATTDSGSSLFASIVSAVPDLGNLFAISASVQIPDEEAVLIVDGDKLFAANEIKAALAKFEQAKKVGHTQHAELLHRIGKCHLRLREYVKAKAVLTQALKLDPNNGALRKDYDTAKRGRT